MTAGIGADYMSSLAETASPGNCDEDQREDISFDSLIDKGYRPPVSAEGVTVGFLNANPFRFGIANLGFQCIADFLLKRGVNVYFSFADTITSRKCFLNAPDVQGHECDIIAISVPFEDTYLNVLRMLEVLRIPLRSDDRTNDDPVVVLGGMAMINPMPLHDFADVFVIGEGRESLFEICRRYGTMRNRHGRVDRRDFLMEIRDIDGTYIPSHYHISMDDQGYVGEFVPLYGKEVVKANVVLDVNENPIFSIWTSEHACYEENDYFSLMAAVGCSRKCPFCVAGNTQGYADGSVAALTLSTLIALVEERRRSYGTSLVKLFFASGLSQSDEVNGAYLKILLTELLRKGFRARVGSLNIKQVDGEILELIKTHGQRSITIAPESSERLRAKIGKAYVTDVALHKVVNGASDLGLDVTVYTMGGLPGESVDDVAALANLIRSLRRMLSKKCAMTIHYNPCFMKAQTPFQSLPTISPDEIRNRYAKLRSRVTDIGGIRFCTVLDDPLTYYQPILASGGPDIGKVLLSLARNKKCTETDWRTAVAKSGIPDRWRSRRSNRTKRLPWEHIIYAHE